MKNKHILLVPAKFGVVAGVLNIILMLILFNAGKHPSLLPPYMDSRILVFIIFMYFAFKEYRDYYNDGYLHFWEGLILGFVLYTIVGIIGFFFILTMELLGTDYFQNYLHLATEGLLNMKDELISGPQAVKMTEEEFQNHLNNLKNTTVVQLAVDYLIKSLIIGFFIPLIYTVFLRKVNR